MREVERDLLGKREDAARELKELKRSNTKTRPQRRRWDGEGGGRNGEGGGRNKEGGMEREVGGTRRDEWGGMWEGQREGVGGT